MDHTTILALVAGILSSISAFVLGIWGAPKVRMAHARAIEKIRGAANERLLASWELRAAKLETRLDEQEAKHDKLQGENAALQDRVEELERQLQAAGLLHKADLATIADLREELASAREELADARIEIAELLKRVGELDALLHRRTDAAAKAAAKKGKSK